MAAPNSGVKVLKTQRTTRTDFNVQQERGKRKRHPPKRLHDGYEIAAGDNDNESESSEELPSDDEVPQSKKARTTPASRGRPRKRRVPNYLTSEQRESFQKKFDNFSKQMLNTWDQTMKAEVEPLKSKIEQQAKDIHDITTASHRRIADLGNVGEQDDDVERRWEAAMNRVKSWAKEFAVSGYVEALDSSDRAAVVKSLVSGRCPPSSESAVKVMFEQGILKSTLVNALFNKIVLQKLINRPFFFLRRKNSSVLDDMMEEVIDECVRLGFIANRVASYLWRSQTINMLYPKVLQGPATYCHNEQQQYELCLTSILSDPAMKPLLKQSNPSQDLIRDKKALNIITEIGKLVLLLTLQKTLLKASSFHSLWNSTLATKSECMRPHNSLGLDEDAATRDKNPVLLVVEPLIEAKGDHDGMNYDCSKVWHRAVVIVRKTSENTATDQSSIKTQTAHQHTSLSSSEAPFEKEGDEDTCLEDQLAAKRVAAANSSSGPARMRDATSIEAKPENETKSPTLQAEGVKCTEVSQPGNKNKNKNTPPVSAPQTSGTVDLTDSDAKLGSDNVTTTQNSSKKQTYQFINTCLSENGT